MASFVPVVRWRRTGPWPCPPSLKTPAHAWGGDSVHFAGPPAYTPSFAIEISPGQIVLDPGLRPRPHGMVKT